MFRRALEVRRLLLPALVVALLWVLAPTAQAAVSAKLHWVEVDVSLRQDGKADIVYKLRWTVTSGEMHGFYLEGMQETPVFNFETSHAQAGILSLDSRVTMVTSRAPMRTAVRAISSAASISSLSSKTSPYPVS